jgi:hypothetical protein
MMKQMIVGMMSVLGIAAVVGTSAAEPAMKQSVTIGSEGALQLKACTGVELKVNNQYSHKIKVKKFQYQVGGAWKDEQVQNTEVAKETTKSIATNKSLADAEGKDITGLKLTFQAWCNNEWGGDYTKSDMEIDNTQCNSSTGKVYRFDTPDANLCD